METCPKVTFISIRHLPVQIKIHKENIRTKCDASEEYSELCQTSKMKVFAKTLNGFQLLLYLLSKLLIHMRIQNPAKHLK